MGETFHFIITQQSFHMYHTSYVIQLDEIKWALHTNMWTKKTHFLFILTYWMDFLFLKCNVPLR